MLVKERRVDMRLYHLDLKFAMYKKEYIKNWFEKLKANGFDGRVNI
ncbi:MAG TPA: hypothetical protein PK733_12130 [Clostridiales bacterium]|nr:hypothetical protein [Clostridiales bacterium]